MDLFPQVSFFLAVVGYGLDIEQFLKIIGFPELLGCFKTSLHAPLISYFLVFIIQVCSRGSACNFIHCFRNPGGDYEWADWDKPPPRYWIEKMTALFGYSDQVEDDERIWDPIRRLSGDNERCVRSSSFFLFLFVCVECGKIY